MGFNRLKRGKSLEMAGFWGFDGSHLGFLNGGDSRRSKSDRDPRLFDICLKEMERGFSREAARNCF